MAEKFDLIAKVEDGETPIELGLAAPAEGSGVTPAQMEMQAAAPTAISVLLVEQTSYSDRDEATKLVALTTLISFMTIPSWATILRV